MNEEKKLDEVTGINALKDQLDDFLEYKKTLETAINEMHKTIVNLSERVGKTEELEKSLQGLRSELEALRKPIGRMAESVGKIDTLADRMESVSTGLESTNSEMKGMKDALESAGRKAEKSLEMKNKLRELVKFIMSD